MDTMEKYKIQNSIEDVIASLDSAPIHRDLISETNIVQLTNRMPIAHLAIERGLKALVSEAGGDYEHEHSLNRLYRILGEHDAKSADYLAEAFKDAVRFFRYNVDDKGFGYFRSLMDYLNRVGKDKDFEALRYWAIGESPGGDSPIPYISPAIHREILCALWCLYLPNRRDTVSRRVEHKVGEAMFGRRHIGYGSDEIRKKESVDWYRNWLTTEHPNRCSAFKEAVHRNFTIKEDDEFVTQTLRDAYNDLQQSRDPAVQYYLQTLSYLRKGSQQQHPDAIPEVEWINETKTRGKAVTPAGTWLGFIEKYADGAWRIEGLAQITDAAESVAVATAYLVNRLTSQVSVTVNGESKQLRILSERDFFPPPEWIRDIEDLPELSSPTLIYRLEFWDGQHGLSAGEVISVQLQPEGGGRLVSVLEGTIIAVEEQKVSIVGTEVITSRQTAEC